jgi:hypothetical protein
VELLFCANCRVSIPVGDVQSGRAVREFGSMLCAQCAGADPGVRSARRKAVETEMAVDAASADPVALRHCAGCGSSVPQGHIVTGRARLDGDRVLCERCTERAPVRTGSGIGTTVLVVLLVAAMGAAGFFGAQYFKGRPASGEKPDLARELTLLRTETSARIAEIEASLDQRDAEARAAADDAFERLREQTADDLVALRSDLVRLRAELQAADGDAAQRIAKLEGLLVGLQEMVRGLAARPAAPESRPPDTARGPEPPVPSEGPTGNGGGTSMPQPPGPAQPDPAVARHVKDLLESQDAGVRYNAALELIRLKALVAIPAFAKLVVEDPNVLVRNVAARGLGEFKAWNAVPMLIQALEDRESWVAQKSNFALQAVTGQDFGVLIDHSPAERKKRGQTALKWWEKNKDRPPEGVCLDPVALQR